VLTLLGGLITIKTAIITTVGPFVGLTLPESVRIGLLLSQGGEFAFVVFSLANRFCISSFPLLLFDDPKLIRAKKEIAIFFFRLGVLPLELNRLLIIVVVLSMSLTPFLNEVGQKLATFIETRLDIPQTNVWIMIILSHK
jgi:Kef-type K+ transport system membrane component KefB